MTDSPLIQKITANWILYKNLVSKIEDNEKRDACLALCEKVADRAPVCPASTKQEYVGCFTGGLVWHSINVTKMMRDLVKLYDVEVPTDSIIVAGLFHDIGKLGNLEEDYYYPQNSQWHRDKGMLFEINSNLSNLSVATRSLYWLNQFHCPLSEDEIGAIMSLNVRSTETISYVPSFKDSWLSIVLQHSVRTVCIKNNGITSLI